MLSYSIRTKATIPKTVMRAIKTFVFFDLETTGLPYLEHNKTKITELTLVAVQEEHLSLGVVPRVQNKLSLCFNPCKLISCDSEQITGLSNFILEHLSPFSLNTVQSINLFLEHNPKPVCLVAHNGNRFDFPILQAEIQKCGGSLSEDILCIDSLQAFRQLHLQDIEPAVVTEVPSVLQVVAPSQDKTDSLPLEFHDGFDELLCNAVEEYENQTDPFKKGLEKALEAQKINEVTPKRPVKSLSDASFDLALGDQMENRNIVPKRPGCFDTGSVGPNNNKKPKAGSSRMKLNFGISFKLGDVYQRLTKEEAVDAHRAEGDVQMLLMCAATMGDRFVAWANENARKFGDVPAMVPGKRMGI